jgi:hypothetical protein
VIEIVPQFLLTYEGNDANEHVIEAGALADSLGGASRLYTAVAHYVVLGVVPRGNYKKEFRCYASIPRDGSYEIPIIIAALAHAYSLHGPIFAGALKFLFAEVLRSVKDLWTKKSSNEKIVEALANAMVELGKQNTDVQTLLANGLIHANDNLASLQSQLIQTLPAIAEGTRNSARALVAPIGNTCVSITQYANSASAIPIDEADAAVIRSDEPLEVDEMSTFKCLNVTEVNLSTGHCILNVEGFDFPVTGKISDPSLANPNNVYTKSLNAQTPFEVSAKPVKRQGVIKTLYISDAKELR